MTMTDASTVAPQRHATKRTILMCRPEYFTVSYRINPWMHPETPTNTELALSQWEVLYQTYLDLGFDVQLVDPIAGLPDMVYAANGGFVLDNIAYGASFTYEERQPEGPAYILLVGDVLLAGQGFRSASNSHEELASIYGRPVISLNLVNPSFYHLDTAVAVLDPEGGPDGTPANIAYLPSAFDEPSLVILRERYPDAIIVTEEDAAVLGLNSYGDGYNMVIAARATDFERQLRERGYNPIGVDLSELLRGGGGVKCCTLELRR
jgi:N-dimethylarginine dimethylaminohydrolase